MHEMHIKAGMAISIYYFFIRSNFVKARSIKMAGPPGDPFLFPLKCAISDDDLPWITPVASIAKTLKDLGDDPDAPTMMKQLYYLRGLVVQEAKRSGHFRCMVGSALEDGSAFIWFPVLLQHVGGLLSIDFFSRLIQMYTLYFAGKLEESAEMSRNIVG